MRASQTGTKLADGRWRIVLVLTAADGTKTRRSISRKTQREAQQAARDYLAKHGRKATDPHTFEELLEECKASRWGSLATNTKIQYDRFGQRAADHFKSLKDIREITTPMVAAYIRGLGTSELSGRSVQIARNVLGIMLKHAAELGWRTSEEVWDVRLPRSAKPAERRRLSYSEAKAVIEAEKIPERALFWWLLMESGIRPIEASTLTKTQLLYSQDSWWVATIESKTEAGEKRWVMISDALAKALYEWPHDPLFPTLPFETATQRRTMQKKWALAMRNAGVAYCNLYQLRKLRITLWKAAGVPDEVVTKMAGHTNIAVANERYDDVTRDRIKRALDGRF